MAYYGIRESDTLFIRLMSIGGAPGPGGQSMKRMAPWSASNRIGCSEQSKRNISAMLRRSARLHIKRRKKEDENKPHSHRSLNRRKTKLTVASFPMKTVSECCNPLPLSNHLLLKIITNSYVCSYRPEQELENLAISKNHVGQTQYTGKPRNTVPITIEKYSTDDQFIKKPKPSQHHKNIINEGSLQHQVETPAGCPEEPCMPRFLKTFRKLFKETPMF